MNTPNKLNSGDEFRGGVVRAVNAIIDYLKATRIVVDNSTIFANQTPSGMVLSGKKAAPVKSAPVDAEIPDLEYQWRAFPGERVVEGYNIHGIYVPLGQICNAWRSTIYSPHDRGDMFSDDGIWRHIFVPTDTLAAGGYWLYLANGCFVFRTDYNPRVIAMPGWYEYPLVRIVISSPDAAPAISIYYHKGGPIVFRDTHSGLFAPMYAGGDSVPVHGSVITADYVIGQPYRILAAINWLHGTSSISQSWIFDYLSIPSLQTGDYYLVYNNSHFSVIKGGYGCFLFRVLQGNDGGYYVEQYARSWLTFLTGN